MGLEKGNRVITYCQVARIVAGGLQSSDIAARCCVQVGTVARINHQDGSFWSNSNANCCNRTSNSTPSTDAAQVLRPEPTFILQDSLRPAVPGCFFPSSCLANPHGQRMGCPVPLLRRSSTAQWRPHHATGYHRRDTAGACQKAHNHPNLPPKRPRRVRFAYKHSRYTAALIIMSDEVTGSILL